MLSICRVVALAHGCIDLQQMEQYREIDFPIAGPLQATDRQKQILAEALEAVSLEDHDSLSAAQIVLASPEGRIVAFENAEQRGKLGSFSWGDVVLVAAPEGLPEFPTFMCEKQLYSGNEMNPHCFEVTDSLGRSWNVYRVRPGLIDWSEFVEMGGIQICQKEDLAERLGRV